MPLLLSQGEQRIFFHGGDTLVGEFVCKGKLARDHLGTDKDGCGARMVVFNSDLLYCQDETFTKIISNKQLFFTCPACHARTVALKLSRF